MANKARRIIRDLNQEERHEYRELVERIEREEKDEIIAKARRYKTARRTPRPDR